MVEYRYYTWSDNLERRMSSMNFVFYGGIVLAVLIIGVLLYRFFQKRGKDETKGRVINKIQDFYSLQDSSNNKPDINY